MNQIEKYNSDLNSSAQNRALEWSGYRNKLMEFLYENLNRTPERTLVIGAGRCDDLDISELVLRSGSLTITDVDLLSMNRALDTYGLSEDQVRVQRIEYTGLEKTGFFDKFLKTILESVDKSDIRSFLERSFMEAETSSFLSGESKSFDLVIVSPIYTQLVFRQILDFAEVLKGMRYPSDKIEYIQEVVLDLMPGLLTRFNQNVSDLVSDTGQLMIVSDIFEYSPNSSFGSRVEKAIQRFETMDAFYQDYLNLHGVGLGDYGLLSMEDFLIKGDYKWFLWPFDEKRRFIVKAQMFHS